jgi:hypothetical protein
MDESQNDERLPSDQQKEVSKNGFAGKLISFFRRYPIIGIVGSIASVIAIPLSVYLSFASIPEPSLTYYVYPIRVPIVQTGKMTDLKVLFNDVPIQGDVTAAQIEIWNSGKAPIWTDEEQMVYNLSFCILVLRPKRNL